MARALIVDDDQDVREFLRSVAEEVGYNTQEAHHGLDALICLKTFPADIMIMDIKIPEMDGLDLIPKVYEEYGYTGPKIIILTGYPEIIPDELSKKVLKVMSKPVREADLVNILKRHKKTDQDANKTPKILIVEDSGTFRLFTKKTLMQCGYRVLEAINGTDALAVINQHSDISLLIVDIHMPEMNGLNLVSKIRKNNQEIPIIIVTSESSDDYIKVGKEIGISGWMVKPVTEEQIKAAIGLVKPKS